MPSLRETLKTKYSIINVPVEVKERIREISGKLGVSMASLIRIVFSSLSIAEEGDEVVLYLGESIGLRKYRNVKLVTSGEVAEVLKENRFLRRELLKLKSENKELRRKVRNLRRKVRKLTVVSEMLKRKIENIERKEEALQTTSTRSMRDAEELIEALREHGLLREAKNWLLNRDTSLPKYANEDLMLALIAYREEILSAPETGEAKEKRKLAWII